MFLPLTGLCPEESPLNTDLTATFLNINPDLLNQMENILSSEDGIDSLLQLISNLDKYTGPWHFWNCMTK